jgi:hypothetical protein
MAVKKGERSVADGQERELDILEFATRLGGWITPPLVGRWLWQKHRNAEAYARFPRLIMAVERRMNFSQLCLRVSATCHGS